MRHTNFQPESPSGGPPREHPVSRAIYLPPWRIDVAIRAGVTPPVPLSGVARTVARALDTVGAPSPASLAVILSADRELAGLNAEHMGHEGPTDVLSFPMLQPSAFPLHVGKAADRSVEPEFRLPARQRLHLGDVIVSVERAAAQAPEQGWSAAEEMLQLVVHGVLHVCGWDHAEEAERNAMRALEARILQTEAYGGARRDLRSPAR